MWPIIKKGRDCVEQSGPRRPRLHGQANDVSRVPHKPEASQVRALESAGEVMAHKAGCAPSGATPLPSGEAGSRAPLLSGPELPTTRTHPVIRGSAGVAGGAGAEPPSRAVCAVPYVQVGSSKQTVLGLESDGVKDLSANLDDSESSDSESWLLDAWLIDHPEPTGAYDCERGSWKTLRCLDCGNEDQRIWDGCHAYDCETCNARDIASVAGQRAKRCFKESGVMWNHWAEVVGTVPPEFRYLFRTKKAIQKFEKSFYKLLREWLEETVAPDLFVCKSDRVLDKIFHVAQTGAYVWTHPVGEDGLSFHPHVNAIMPLAVLVWDRKQNGWEVKPVGKYLRSEVELADLRMRYREMLVDIMGLREDHDYLVSIGVEGGLVPDVDVHYSFVKGDDFDRKFHRLKYCSRAFPGWKWLVGTQRKFGFFAPRVVRGYLGHLVDPMEPPQIGGCEECGSLRMVALHGDEEETSDRGPPMCRAA